jgi:hypothetical protein
VSEWNDIKTQHQLRDIFLILAGMHLAIVNSTTPGASRACSWGASTGGAGGTQASLDVFIDFPQTTTTAAPTAPTASPTQPPTENDDPANVARRLGILELQVAQQLTQLWSTTNAMNSSVVAQGSNLLSTLTSVAVSVDDNADDVAALWQNASATTNDIAALALSTAVSTSSLSTRFVSQDVHFMSAHITHIIALSVSAARACPIRHLRARRSIWRALKLTAGYCSTASFNVPHSIVISFSISDVSNTVGSLVNAVRTAVQTAATGGGGSSMQPPAVSTGSNNELMLTSQTQVGAAHSDTIPSNDLSAVDIMNRATFNSLVQALGTREYPHQW